MENRIENRGGIVVHSIWDVTQGDYKPDELSYVKQHELAKQERKREMRGVFIALGVVAFAVMFLFMTFASKIRI